MTAIAESASFEFVQQRVGKGRPIESRSINRVDTTVLEPSTQADPVSYRADGTVHIKGAAMTTGLPYLVHLDDLILLVVKEADGTVAYYEVELPSA